MHWKEGVLLYKHYSIAEKSLKLCSTETCVFVSNFRYINTIKSIVAGVKMGETKQKIGIERYCFSFQPQSCTLSTPPSVQLTYYVDDTSVFGHTHKKMNGLRFKANVLGEIVMAK